MMPLFSYVDPVSANLMWHASILKQVVHEFKFLSCAMLYFYIDNFSRIYCGTQIKFIRQYVLCVVGPQKIFLIMSQEISCRFSQQPKKNRRKYLNFQLLKFV